MKTVNTTNNTALLIVDVQYDFCEGGSLAVHGGNDIASAITEHVHKNEYSYIVATRDYHIDPGDHFSDNPDFVNSWPTHCVTNTHGSKLHKNLPHDFIQEVFNKGSYTAAYSGFEGVNTKDESLVAWLHDHNINCVDIVGIATDHCVRATALDAQAYGFRTTVLLNLTAGVAYQTTQYALDEMQKAGITLTGKPVLQNTSP